MTLEPVTKIYICGPIDTAGQKEKNIETFIQTEAWLDWYYRGKVNVVNPTKSGTEGLSYIQFIKNDIRQLLECEAIVLLPGWPQSKGARGELNIAMYLNMRVFYCDIDAVTKLIDMNFPE